VGGPGSGSHYHWWRGNKKSVVEDCWSLDANRWMREGILKAGVRYTGASIWYRDATLKETVSSIGYEVNTIEAGPWVRLFYTVTRTGEELNYRIHLETTRPRFGGLRWWFICPLIVNGRSCERRVGKVHLAPGSRYFGCRHCHRLTYSSTQTHDKRVDAFRRNPELVDALMENLSRCSPGQLILMLKAVGWPDCRAR
jgi:hypothetical protein